MSKTGYVITDDVTLVAMKPMKGLGTLIGITFKILPQNEEPITIPAGRPTYATVAFMQDGKQLSISQVITASEISKDVPIILEGIYYPGTEPFLPDAPPISDVKAAIYYYLV